MPAARGKHFARKVVLLDQVQRGNPAFVGAATVAAAGPVPISSVEAPRIGRYLLAVLTGLDEAEIEHMSARDLESLSAAIEEMGAHYQRLVGQTIAAAAAARGEIAAREQDMESLAA